MDLLNYIASATGYTVLAITALCGAVYFCFVLVALTRWLLSRLVGERPWQELKCQRFIHTKRGTAYVMVGEGRLQTSRPLSDMEAMTAYRNEETGEWWFRPVDEFDMRFEFEGMAR